MLTVNILTTTCDQQESKLTVHLEKPSHLNPAGEGKGFSTPQVKIDEEIKLLRYIYYIYMAYVASWLTNN